MIFLKCRVKFFCRSKMRYTYACHGRESAAPHFLLYILFTECSSGLKIPKFDEMKEMCVGNVPKDIHIETEFHRKLFKALKWCSWTFRQSQTTPLWFTKTESSNTTRTALETSYNVKSGMKVKIPSQNTGFSVTSRWWTRTWRCECKTKKNIS